MEAYAGKRAAFLGLPASEAVANAPPAAVDVKWAARNQIHVSLKLLASTYRETKNNTNPHRRRTTRIALSIRIRQYRNRL